MIGIVAGTEAATDKLKCIFTVRTCAPHGRSILSVQRVQDARQHQGSIMNMKFTPTVFGEHEVRRLYDEKTETWFFSVVDIIQVLTQQSNYQAARNYWKVLKTRLRNEGNESVTKCNRLKLPAADGKNYLTDVANAETLLRLVQSVPSPKAEPIKLWLAKVGYERMKEMTDRSSKPTQI